MIRKANNSDIDALLKIKAALNVPTFSETPVKEGFLLGSTPEMYSLFIEHADTRVAERNGEIRGFGIVLPDSMLKNSDIWRRKDQVNWLIDIQEIEQEPICYFEQLAFVPGHRSAALELAFLMAWHAFKSHKYLIATTVVSPWQNLAAVPFILGCGGFKIGQIDEVYPEAGNIVSDVYLISEELFRRNTAHHPLIKRFKADFV